ncbi:HalOD1 output domain-containing protein [Natrinema versiforme]|uniref:HalOD1 output domain-containing protein n=1 Tax=Natrinema versiforme TaxID=88724 RepID=UPI001EF9D824|nr:HalOD1 output domain-containing protein [Natrinema versiforme]
MHAVAVCHVLRRIRTGFSKMLQNAVIDIIETLEACGLDRNDYQLYDAVDVDVLEQILNSSSGNVEVQFTGEGIRLSVTPESVDILIDDEANSTEQ